jgi:hypothetical protein
MLNSPNNPEDLYIIPTPFALLIWAGRVHFSPFNILQHKQLNNYYFDYFPKKGIDENYATIERHHTPCIPRTSVLFSGSDFKHSTTKQYTQLANVF